MKKCIKCKVEKNESEFYYHSGHKKLSNECKSCNNLGTRFKVYREKNRDKILEKQRARFKTPIGNYRDIISRAKMRNLDFALSFDEFMQFWQKDCHYCGNKIETVGLDRIDSSAGYIYGNIVSCCTFCNKMKLNHTVEDFIEHCIKIVERSGIRDVV